MVILGLERPVEYGSRQIFDPTMANMVLNAQNNYIQAMKEDYLRGREDLKEFNKNFGDFFSPIQKDMEWYDQNVTGATRDLINNLYAQGIDPLRSAEGRAAISRWINNMPTGQINQLKQSAAVANEYLKNMGDLMAKGRYNPDAEKFFGRDLATWDTLGGSGIWGASSPIENMTMDEIIEPIIKNLDYTYDEARTKQANDGNDYYTVTEDRIRQTIADAMEDLTRNGTMPGYYYNKALQAVGGDRDKAISLYTDWLTNRGKDHLKEKFEPNKWKLLQKEHQYRMAEQYAKSSGRSGGRSGSGRGTAEYDNPYGWTARRMAASYIQRQMQNGNIKTFADWAKTAGKKVALPGKTQEAIRGYFKASQDTPEPGETLMALELFSNGLGTSKYTHEGDSSTKTTVSFMDDDLRPTNIAEVQWAGRNLNANGVSRRWLKFLHDRSVSGEAKGKVTVNHQLVNKNGIDTHIMEMNRIVRLDREWIDAFVDEYARSKGHSGASDEFKQEVISKLGLRGVGTKDGDDYSYYDMPTSRRIEMAGDDRALVDTYSDALEFTKATAAKRETDYINDPQ